MIPYDAIRITIDGQPIYDSSVVPPREQPNGNRHERRKARALKRRAKGKTKR